MSTTILGNCPPLPPTRIRHRGDKVDERGRVSALCFATPRAIDMTRATWVMSDDAVTCPKCRALIERIDEALAAPAQQAITPESRNEAASQASAITPESAPEWAGAGAFIQHAQNVAEAPGHWPDEFLAWYKPDDWSGEHRAAAVFLGLKFAAHPSVKPSPTVGDPTEDLCIELAAALEMHRALHIVAEVAALPVGGKDATMPTQFAAGYQLACDEIAERIRTQQVVIPGGAVLPLCGTLPSVAQPSSQADPASVDRELDAARYRWLLANYACGDGWEAIDKALNDGNADTHLSPAIDAAIAAQAGEKQG